MKYAVGYQLSEFSKLYLKPEAEQNLNLFSFIDIIEDYKDSIAEIYFPWINNPSGRSSLVNDRGYFNWSGQERLLSDLRIIKKSGIKLDLLFNANCHGKDAVSEYLANNICSIIDYLNQTGCSPDIVTAASPFIASVIKKRYDIEVRASVNMRIGSVKGMEYIAGFFDSFHIQKECNRDFAAIAELKEWADKNGKKLIILANSGCLSYCSWQTYHDNAVAHEQEIAEMKNLKFNTHGCWDFLKNTANRVSLLQSSWIRPDDIGNYTKYFDVVKLATRMHSLPAMVVDAYAKQRYCGNLLDLFEPGFGPVIAPYVIDNSKFPGDWFEKTSSCDKKCHKCKYCEDVLKEVLTVFD